MSENGNGHLPEFLLQLESQGRSPATVRTYRSVIAKWERSELDPVQYLAGLTTRPSTRVYYGKVLQLYHTWQVQQGLLPLNPLSSLHFRRPPSKPVRPFSQQEVGALLVACRTPQERAVIVTLSQTGVRASELVGLRWRDIDTAQGIMAVVGKGNKPRLLGISHEVLVTLRCVGGDDWVFPDLNYQRLHRLVKALAVDAGVTDAHPHRFRHSFAHNFLAAGGDATDLKMLLGHSRWEMIEHYTAFFAAERAVDSHRRYMDGLAPPPAGSPQGIIPRRQVGGPSDSHRGAGDSVPGERRLRA